MWILLATRSFEEDAIIGDNSVILRRATGIASNVPIVFTMLRACVTVCACVHKNLPRMSQLLLGNNFRKSERRFEQSVLPDASIRGGCCYQRAES